MQRYGAAPSSPDLPQNFMLRRNNMLHRNTKPANL